MQTRSRVLVAAQPAAWQRVRPILEPLVEAVPVHTTEAAFQALDRDGIQLIICTVAFDDSRMIEFLQAVKAVPAGSIPFVCARLLPGVLTDSLVESTREVCMQCGAAAFVDVAKLDHDKARVVLEGVLTTYLPRT